MMQRRTFDQILQNITAVLIEKEYLSQDEENQLQKLEGFTNYSFVFRSVKSGEKRVARWIEYDYRYFIDREREREVLKKLELENLYPKIFLYEKQLKIENFIENEGTILPDDLLTDLNLTNILFTKLKNIYEIISDNKEESNENLKIVKFLKDFENIKEEILKEIFPFVSSCIYESYQDILNQLQNFVPQLLSMHLLVESDIAVCHCDLNPSNLLKLEKKRKDLGDFGERMDEKELIQKPNDKNDEHCCFDIQILDYEYCGANLIIYDLANLVHELQSNYWPQFSLRSINIGPESQDEETKQLRGKISEVIELFRKTFPNLSKKYSTQKFEELIYGFRAYNLFFWICLTIKSEKMNQDIDFSLINCAKLRFAEFKISFEILKKFFN